MSRSRRRSRGGRTTARLGTRGEVETRDRWMSLCGRSTCEYIRRTCQCLCRGPSPDT